MYGFWICWRSLMNAEIFFPTFTPNNPVKEGFGPLISLYLLKNYRLTVYGRWGEQGFTSTNRFGWNGTHKEWKEETQTFTWMYPLSMIFYPLQKELCSSSDNRSIIVFFLLTFFFFKQSFFKSILALLKHKWIFLFLLPSPGWSLFGNKVNRHVEIRPLYYSSRIIIIFLALQYHILICLSGLSQLI